MTIRAVLYGRVSSDEQADNFSLSTQIAAMQRYAEVHDIKVVEEFREDYSGLKLSRPELDKIRALAHDGAIDAVIVYSSDRFTRSRAHGPILRDELKAAGVALHFVSRGKVESTLESELLASTEDTFNWYWWAKMQEAMQRGRRGKAEAGIIPGAGCIPLGYGKEGRSRDMRLVIVPDQATVVEQIFTWFVRDHMSVNALSERLTARGILTPTALRTKSSHCRWNTRSVYNILRSEAYIGTFYAYRQQRREGKTTMRPREEWLPISVPPIVERDVWEQAQHLLDEGRRLYRRPAKYEYLMARHVKCTCGRGMSGRPSKDNDIVYLSYGCNAAERSRRTECPSPRFKTSTVDTVIWEWVVQLLKDPQALVEGYREAQQTLSTEHQAIQEQVALVDKQIGKQEVRLSGLIDELAEATSPRIKAMIREKCQDVEAVLSSLATEREALTTRLVVATITDEHIQSIEEFAADVRDEIDTADFALKRQIIEALNLHCTLALEDGVKVIYLHWYTHTNKLCMERNATRSSASLSEDGP